MPLSDKKTERVLMRVTPDMRKEVEAIAILEGRPINHQYRLLIMLGLEHRRALRVAGIRVETCQPLSTQPSVEGETRELSSTFGNRKRRSA